MPSISSQPKRGMHIGVDIQTQHFGGDYLEASVYFRLVSPAWRFADDVGVDRISGADGQGIETTVGQAHPDFKPQEAH